VHEDDWLTSPLIDIADLHAVRVEELVLGIAKRRRNRAKEEDDDEAKVSNPFHRFSSLMSSLFACWLLS
jgi:hypothetical protein